MYIEWKYLEKYKFIEKVVSFKPQLDMVKRKSRFGCRKLGTYVELFIVTCKLEIILVQFFCFRAGNTLT